MKLKKNTSKDLNLKRGLYFVLSLLLILLLIYIVLEWKTIDTNDGYDVTTSLNTDSSTFNSGQG